MGKEKNKVSVVFMGHVDSGKSTLTGNLLFQCGAVDKRTLEKFEKESAEMGKGSFKYAWICDKTAQERSRGITVECGNAKLSLPNVDITIIDAPGHKDFIKNFLTGAAVADTAVLVVPASPGEAETAIGPDGTAREHARLAHTLGVKQLCVVVNKMDAAGYAQSRFDEVATETARILTKIGYPKKNVAFMPASAWVGDNIITKGNNIPWYSGWTYERNLPDKSTVEVKGVTLFDWLDGLLPVARPTDKPLRAPVYDCYKISGVGTVSVARIETGIMKPGMVAYIAPAGITAEIKSIEMHHESLEEALPGDNIGANVKNIAVSEIKRGYVIGDSKNDPPRSCETFEAQIIVVHQLGRETKGICKGYSPVIDCHTAHIACNFTEIKCKIDKRTGKPLTLEEDEAVNIRVRLNESALVVLKPKSPFCCEAFSHYPALGRFAVRDCGRTVAVGVIKSVVKKEPEVKGSKAGAAGAKGAAPGKGGAAKAGGKK